MTGARECGLNAILAIDAGAQLQEALDKQLGALSVSDRHFCSDLVYGTVRSRIRLDYLLKKVFPKPEKLPTAMLTALQMAVYSLLFQVKVPAYAAINETVKLVKKSFGQKLANVANGALRAIQRLEQKPDHLEWYDSDPFRAATIYYALPFQIAQLWREAYGEKAALNLMARSFARPHSCLRLNPHHPEYQHLVTDLNKSGAEKVASTGYAFGAGQMPALLCNRDLSYWHDKGAFSYQAAGSQLVLQESGIYSNWQDVPIWDACAGMGGKTLAMLEAGLNVALATDNNQKRLGRLSKECQRLNLIAPQIILANAAMSPLSAWDGNILADVPCSGLGVLARRPDIKARWNAEQARKLVQHQKQILSSLVSLLKLGRELCYLTCTLVPAENEQQLDWLTKNYDDLEIVKIWQTPAEHPWLEGMFGAIVRKIR